MEDKRPPPRRLTMKWKRWTAESFIRVMDRLTREEAIEILSLAR